MLTKLKILELLTYKKFFSVLKNPRDNPQETLLVVGILTVAFLILLVLTIFIASLLRSWRKRRKTKS